MNDGRCSTLLPGVTYRRSTNWSVSVPSRSCPWTTSSTATKQCSAPACLPAHQKLARVNWQVSAPLSSAIAALTSPFPHGNNTFNGGITTSRLKIHINISKKCLKRHPSRTFLGFPVRRFPENATRSAFLKDETESECLRFAFRSVFYMLIREIEKRS